MVKLFKFSFLLATAYLIYLLYFKSSFWAQWAIWPGSPLEAKSTDMWFLSLLRWAICNKVTGCIFIVVAIIDAFSTIFSFATKCPKCGSQEIAYGNEKTTSKRYKHSNKDGGKDFRFKDNPLIINYRRNAKCDSCSHSWANEYSKEALA